MNPELSIGELADATGVGVETIRFYERRGLMAQPRKPASGYWRYPAATARRLRFIKRAQGLGFTLDEIGGLLALDEAQACGETRPLAERKLELIEHKLADLNAMRDALARLMRECAPDGGAARCPIIDALAAD